MFLAPFLILNTRPYASGQIKYYVISDSKYLNLGSNRFMYPGLVGRAAFNRLDIYYSFVMS